MTTTNIIKITLNNRQHTISCSPGDENKIANLADQLDKRLQMIAGKFKSQSDITSMVVCMLYMQQELSDVKDTIDRSTIRIAEFLEEKPEKNLDASIHQLVTTVTQSVADIYRHLQNIMAP